MSFPASFVEDTILAEDRFHANNVAELPVMDLDILPLPQLPLDDTFMTDWLIGKEEEARNDQSMSITYAEANESYATTSRVEPLRGIDDGSFMEALNFSIESVLHSPLLAASNEEKQSMRVSPLPSVPGEDVDDEHCSVRSDSTETGKQVSPISPRFCGKERTTYSELSLLGVSNTSQLSCSTDSLDEISKPALTESLNSKKECSNNNFGRIL